jgi:hypothetical protein
MVAFRWLLARGNTTPPRVSAVILWWNFADELAK